MSDRQVVEGRVAVGKGFARPFTITVPASWGTPTGTPTITIYELPLNTDVTATATSGSNSVNGQVITTKSVLRAGMTAGKQYKAIVEFSLASGGSDSFPWIIDCED